LSDGGPTINTIGNLDHDRHFSLRLRAGFDPTAPGGLSLKRGALSTGMDRKIHPTRLKQLGRHKTYAVLDAYLELGDPFEGHPLNGVL
jgi:hypothetical protein